MRCAVLLSVVVGVVTSQAASAHVVLVGAPVIHPGYHVITYDPQERQSTAPCSCVSNVCKCCFPVNIPQINVNQLGCLSTIYDSDNLAISIHFKFGDNVIFNQTLSASNPPPICYPIPQLPMVMVCLRLYKIKLVHGGIYTCIKVEIHLLTTPVLILNFDCVQITNTGITASKPTIAQLSPPATDVGNVWYVFKPGNVPPALITTTVTNNQSNDEGYDVVNETKNPPTAFLNIHNSSKTITSIEGAINILSNSIGNATVVAIDGLDAGGNNKAGTSDTAATSTTTQSSEGLELGKLDSFTKLGETDKK